MSDSQQQFFSDMWYQRRWWAWLFLPLSCLFWLITFVRHQYLIAFIKPKKPYAVPVVIVGNITVGGVGKTPLLISLCEALAEKNIKVGVISRGYGSRAKHFPLIVDDSTSIADSGDEPALIFRRTKCPVVIGPDRHLAVNCLLSNFTVDVVLSDDGLQHYALWRDLEIAVVDGKRGLGNGMLLPAGPLREGSSRLKRVDVVCVNGQETTDVAFELCLPTLRNPLVSFSVRAAYWRRLGSQEIFPLHRLGDNQRFHAIAGIGNPQRFLQSLQNLKVFSTVHIYPDHYDYQEQDLVFSDKLPVVTTEKDAAKIEPLLAKLSLEKKSSSVANLTHVSAEEEMNRREYWALGVAVDVPELILEKIVALASKT